MMWYVIPDDGSQDDVGDPTQEGDEAPRTKV